MWHVGLGGRCQANMSLCHTMAASMPLSCGSKLVWVHLSSTFQPAQAILALSSKNLVSAFQQWHQAMAASSPPKLVLLLFLCFVVFVWFLALWVWFISMAILVKSCDLAGPAWIPYWNDDFLGGGLKRSLCSLGSVGRWSKFDLHIFQMGWNHQLVTTSCLLNVSFSSGKAGAFL